MYKLLIKFPSRQRSTNFFKTLKQYYKNLNNLKDTSFVIICDLDDDSMNNSRVQRRISKYNNLTLQYGNSKSKIEAINAVMPYSKWDILLLASDDMIPIEFGFDDIIREQFRKYFPNLDGVLWFNDGYRKDELNTLPILGKKYYERFLYIYNPVYTSFWADNEFMDIANMLKKQKYFDKCIIKHNHPDNTGQPYDELYNLQKSSEIDHEIYIKRNSNNYFLLKLLIIQPGRTGDILICLPIAELYSKTFVVYWNCPLEYHQIFDNIDYCTPVENKEGNYDKILDLSFGFDGQPENWWQQNKMYFDSFVTAKYYLAQINLKHRWNLKWIRNKSKENSLLKTIQNSYGMDYILVHEESHDGKFVTIDCKNKVEFRYYDKYNIFDWYKVILNAIEIHCIDSSLANFIEAVPEFKYLNKTMYLTTKAPIYYLRSIFKNNWRILQK